MSKNRAINWEDFKENISKNFFITPNLSQAWKEIEAERYNIDEPPRAFIQLLTCKYAALEQKFPNDTLPNKDQLLKNKIYRGLPPQGKNIVHDFLGSETQLTTFIDMVENYRLNTYEAERARVRVCAVSTEKKEDIKADEEPSDVQAQIKTLARQVYRMNNNSTPYCAFCRTKNHTLAKCPENPPRGVCFDCLRPECRRGNKDCPKKNSPSQE